MAPGQCNCECCTITTTEYCKNSTTTDSTYKTQCYKEWYKEEEEFEEKKIHPKHQRNNKYRNR